MCSLYTLQIEPGTIAERSRASFVTLNCGQGPEFESRRGHKLRSSN